MLGRNNPSKNCRVFSDVPKEFYKIDPLNIDYAAQHELAVANGLVSDSLDLSDVKAGLTGVMDAIAGSEDYQNLLNGPAIPFCLSFPSGTTT